MNKKSGESNSGRSRPPAAKPSRPKPAGPTTGRTKLPKSKVGQQGPSRSRTGDKGNVGGATAPSGGSPGPKRGVSSSRKPALRVQKLQREITPALDRSPRAMLTLYRPDFARTLTAMDCAPYRYGQTYQHLFHKPLQPFSEATALPADLRESLDALGVSTLTQIEDQTAADGTTKLLLSTADGAYLESVIMRYSERVTLCVSSQIGCPVGCLFCATGSMGFRRNLTPAEIVDQVRVAAALAGREEKRVSNVVFMGMGEPLLNLQAVLDSIRILTDPDGFGLSHRALSVSTIGIPSGMRRLGRAEPQVNLALSLHAADDVTRALLVPKRYLHPIAEILDAAWEHFAVTHRKLLVEYVLLGGLNDSQEHALALARLLRGHVVAVNLLAWNPVSRATTEPPRAPARQRTETAPGQRPDRGQRPAQDPAQDVARAPLFRAPAASTVAAFREVLAAHHIEAVVRRSKGGAIQGACGQLAGRRKAASTGPRREPAVDS